MIRKFSIAILAAAALSGCVTSGYGYRGGTGDYYYGRSSADYYYYDSAYRGYGYGYGSPYYYSSGYGYYGYPYGYPYYYYHPRPHPPGNAPPRRVPNKPIPGYEYPPNAIPYPNRPGTTSRRPVAPPQSTGLEGARPGIRSDLERARGEAAARTRVVAPQPQAMTSPAPRAPVAAPRARSGESRIESRGESRIQSRGIQVRERELRR